MNGVPAMVSTVKKKKEHYAPTVLSHLSKHNILTLKQQLEICSAVFLRCHQCDVHFTSVCFLMWVILLSALAHPPKPLGSD